VSRIDGPLKVQGRATFAAELVLDNMVYAALAFSTLTKGRIAALDTSAAQAAPGVVLVMTHRNAPRMQRMPLFLTGENESGDRGFRFIRHPDQRLGMIGLFLRLRQHHRER
jgi:xanthine dehydrogenase YagR molybdenum-binding subunit